MKTLIITLTMALAVATAHADERDLSSEAPKLSKSQQIRAYAQTCFDQEISLFESTKGRLPSNDEADFIIDACANPNLK